MPEELGGEVPTPETSSRQLEDAPTPVETLPGTQVGSAVAYADPRSGDLSG